MAEQRESGSGGPPAGPHDGRRRVWVGLCALVLSGWWGASALSAGHARVAGRALRRAEFARADPSLAAAVRWMPWNPDVLLARAASAQARAFFAPEPAGSTLRQRALDDLHRAAGIAPGRAEVHLRIAWLLEATSRQAAEQAFLRAIRCDPTLGLLHGHYGDYLLSTGRYAEAAEAYRRALSAFNETRAYSHRRIFEKLYRVTGDLDLVRLACPDNVVSQRERDRFFAEKGVSTPP